MRKAIGLFALAIALMTSASNSHAYSITGSLEVTVLSIYSPFKMSADLTTHGDALYGFNSCKQDVAKLVKNDIEEYVASGIASESLSATFDAIEKENPEISEEEMIDLILEEFKE